MTLICDFESKSSGYNNLFFDKRIGLLVTSIHAAKISSGTELEHIIQEAEGINLIDDVDLFFENINSFKIGTYLINKKNLKYSKLSLNVSQKLEKNILVDFIIIKIDNDKIKHCYILELKSGCNFDTKKTPAEKNNLLNYETQLAKKIQATTSIHICSFFEDNKEKIKSGLKQIFDDNEILTGKELCYLLNINYDDILTRISKDKKDNDEYFIKKVKDILREENLDNAANY